nr:ankyrin repeat domain-containing protein 26-like [Marmota flaviventris]
MGFLYKANTRLHRAASEGDVDKVNHILTHGEAGVDDRDKKNRFAEKSGFPASFALIAVLFPVLPLPPYIPDVHLSGWRSPGLIGEQVAGLSGTIGHTGHTYTAVLRRTPLHYACAFGHWDMVALLIEKKCNLELLDNDYNTPLIKAAEHQHERCVNLLLDNGANPNVQDKDGYSPLHRAVFSRNTAMAEKLLSHNANMEFQNKDGHTPLLLALKHNRQRVAALLIRKKANIHVVDKEKRTALILATKYDAKCIVELLLQEGIDAFAEDQSGKNALSHAIASGFNVSGMFGMQSRPLQKSRLLRRRNTVHEGKGEVHKYFWQSRNDGKYDQNKQGNRTLLDSSDSDNEAENVVWNTCAKNMKVKSLHGTPPTSRGKKSVSEPLPLSCVGKFTVAEDQRAEQKINKHKEDDLGTSSHRNRLRTANIAQPDDARILGTLVSNAAPPLEITSEEEQNTLEGSESNQLLVSTSNKMGKDLLDKYHRIKDIIARKRIEIDTIKHENQEKEKKYLEDIEILKGKYDDLQKTIKQKEETAGANPFQDNEQFNKMKGEITMLKFQLEYEKENRERLETEVKSYHATLAAEPFHHYEGQTSKGYQEFAFQSTREEYLRSQAKMNFDISRLKVHSEVVSEDLVKYEERFCSLKNKVCQTRHAVKEMTLNLETLQRDLRQTQCQIKKIKYTYHNEQTKVNKYDGKQDSTEERLQPQTENTLLQQQLHKPHNESVNKDTVISIQQQCHDIVEKLRAETKNHYLILENIINKLSSKCDRIEERLNQYENEKTERTVSTKHKNI